MFCCIKLFRICSTHDKCRIGGIKEHEKRAMHVREQCMDTKSEVYRIIKHNKLKNMHIGIQT